MWPAIALLAAAASGISLLLASGSGGVAMVGGEPVRTGPVPVWLVELLYAPGSWAIPAVGAAAALVAGVAYVGYRRNGGLDDEVKREALDNLVVVASIGATTLAVASALPYWAAVAAGPPVGFAASIPLRGWLGL